MERPLIKKLLGLLVATSALIAVAVQAAPLVSFDTNIALLLNTTPVAGVAADTTDPVFEDTVFLTRGPGLTAQAFTGRLGASGFSTGAEADAISAGDYLSFVLTPASGDGFDLGGSSLSIVTQTGANGPLYLGVYTSIGGFEAGDALATLALARTGTAQDEVRLDLSSIAGTITAPLEIRFYGYGANLDSGPFSINKLSIVPVPEPASLAALLAAAALAGAVSFRRRGRPRA
ncbi:PEP-CTERM putative exosortase interaction domain-containing protein [Opitutaceae bacterium TAV1]|nr:PEP-CTERM putative exosortase interaction domain-containing protein [Opitutaceae bacterium TAV1]